MKKNITTIVLSLFVLLSFNQAYAANVKDVMDVAVNCVSDCPDEGLVIRGADGTIKTTIIKAVNFVRASGNNTNLNFNLNIGSIVTLDAKESGTTADWFFLGGHNDSPPADGKYYKAFSHDDGGARYTWYFAASKPNDTEKPVITSKNPRIVECSNTGCTALKEGTATVEITFPNVKQITDKEILGRTDGYGKIWFDAQRTKKNLKSDDPLIIDEVANAVLRTYQFPKLTYTITVPPNPNVAQVSACQSVTNVNQNSAKLNWSYTDADNDAQTNYQIQVSTNSSFTNIVKSIAAPANTNVSAIRSASISGLAPNTTYYARVSTYNNANTWSGYSVCSGGFTTTANTPHVVNYTNTTAVTESEATVNWTYSDAENDVQTGYEVGLSKVSDFGTVSPVRLVVSGNNSSIRSASFTSLEPNTLYYVRVRAANTTNGWSDYSVGSFTTVSDATELNVSCQLGGPAYIDENVEVQSVLLGIGTPPYTYKWSGPGFSTKYTQDIVSMFTTTGRKDITLEVTDAMGIVDTESCPLNITCDPSKKADDSACVGGMKTVDFCGLNGWESREVTCSEGDDTGATVSTFSFVPYIANENSVCPLVLEVENTSGCELTSLGKATYSYLPQGAGTSISIQKTESVPIGTWQLSCSGTGPTPVVKSFGIQKCLTNPGIKEN